jgi:hypothetical protein
MLTSNNFFNQQFINEHDKILLDFNSSSSSSYYYNDLKNAITQRPGFHQLCAEFTITSFLKQELEKNQWTIINQSKMYNGTHPGNQLTAIKNDKTLVIIFGDSLDQDQVINFDYVITDAVYDFVPNATTIHINPEIYGLHTTSSGPYVDKLPTKLFNCFISAADAYRQCWFYNFVRRGYLDQANISFLLNNRVEEFSENRTANKIQEYTTNKLSNINDIFNHEHQLMLDHVPYKNFSVSLEDAIIDSKASLVLETSFACPGQIYFTEKTFRAAMLPRPFFVVARQGNKSRISYLREIGFDVYDDVIDHSSYDYIKDPIQQMLAVFDQIEKLRNFEYTPTVLNEFEQRAQHNRELINKFNSQLGQKYQTIIDQLQQIS